MRDRLEKDIEKILNITPISKGETGSMQKAGAVEAASAESKKVDRYQLDTKGIRFFKQVHHMLVEEISHVINQEEKLVIPDITATEGYAVVNVDVPDFTDLSYDFVFNLDLSSLDRQARDEKILLELYQADKQYANTEDPTYIPAVTISELLIASSLSADRKDDILERIKQEEVSRTKVLKEQQKLEEQAMQQQQQAAAPQPPAQDMMQGIPQELLALLAGGAEQVPQPVAPPAPQQTLANMLPPEVMQALMGGQQIIT
jgi:hypothetical protein